MIRHEGGDTVRRSRAQGVHLDTIGPGGCHRQELQLLGHPVRTQHPGRHVPLRALNLVHERHPALSQVTQVGTEHPPAGEVVDEHR